jgi:hypothetical protein
MQEGIALDSQQCKDPIHKSHDEGDYQDSEQSWVLTFLLEVVTVLVREMCEIIVGETCGTLHLACIIAQLGLGSVGVQSIKPMFMRTHLL